MTFAARVAGALALGALALLAACGEGDRPVPLQRTGVLGSLRDLVLFERREQSGGPFFLDRFEATRGDFAEFAAATAGAEAVPPARRLDPEEAVLPMGGVDLARARAFARWRCCRLPRSDEWAFACTTDGRDTYPWGSNASPARANTSDLGVFAPLPVGTFESGRSGDGPYDLIGNVAEWTETVPGAWFHAERDALPPFGAALRRAHRLPAWSVWRVPGTMLPPQVVVAVAGDSAPREVLGADYVSSMRDAPQLRAPSDRSDTLGVRLCTTPRELLLALADERARFAVGDLVQLERFWRRGNHAAVLARALAELPFDAEARAFFARFAP